MSDWLRAFLATHVIEVPIVAGWLWPRLGRRAILWALLASTLSHPILWFIWPRLGPQWLWLGSGELAVWLFEGLIYAFALRSPEGRPDWKVGMGVSFLANLSSLTTGLLLIR